MRLGLDVFLEDKKIQSRFAGQRVGVVAHPASVDRALNHTVDLLKQRTSLEISCAFGPQHGMRGEKQDNMVESEDYIDPKNNIPVFSLYGEVRRPSEKMLQAFDSLIFDLQDVGCRIYTYATTLIYLIEDCAREGKSLMVLDRPNPAGRPVEGSYLRDDFHTFVGAARCPMRHGLTLGELGLWYIHSKKIDIDYHLVEMEGYQTDESSNWGWPQQELSWVNPSPNLPTLNGVRAYCGTVLLEGTLLSEGRGTTRPLENFGAPKMDGEAIKREMQKIKSEWLDGVLLRPCFFEPTFHKFQGEICGGLQIHADANFYDHNAFKPYRLVALYLKAVKKLYPNFKIFREPPYEYEEKIKPFDMLSGSSFLREWIENQGDPEELENHLTPEEKDWAEERTPHLRYS